MSLAENLLNSLDETAYQNMRIAGGVPEEHIKVGQDRVITVPNSLKTIAVKGDKDIETVTFDCVRYWDGHDLSTFAIYLNYVLPDLTTGTYIPEKITTTDGDEFYHFDWQIENNITAKSGKISFAITAIKTKQNESGETVVYKQWSSIPNTDCSIALGLDISNVPSEEEGSGVLAQMSAILGQIQEDFDEWLKNNLLISQTTGESETAVMSQKATTEALAYQTTIVKSGKPREYMDGYYHLQTGVFTWSNNYKSTRYLPRVLFDFIKIPFSTEYRQNVLSFKNNGSYCGYYMNGVYRTPDGTETDSLDFDEFALCVNTNHTAIYDRVWFETPIYLKNLEPLYNGKIEWINGYYHFMRQGQFTVEDTHKCTPYMGAYMFDKINGLEPVFANADSGMVFKKDGVYVGSLRKGVYYSPTNSVVNGIDFDEFAINIEIAYSNIDYTKIKIMSLNDIKTNLFGKKLGVIGDSIAYGAGYAGGYGGIIGTMYNMTVENRAVNGATLVPSTNLPEILPQLNNLSDDCDYIILEGGYNDSWANGGSPIGEYSADFGEPIADGTFYGNLNYLLYNALVKFHGKKMCFVIVHQSKPSYSVASDSEYYLATVKLCNKWGVPIVDLNKNCPPLGMVATTNPLYTDYTNLSGNPDGVHPSENGYRKYYVPQIVSRLEAL